MKTSDEKRSNVTTFKDTDKDKVYKMEIVWSNVVRFTLLHLMAMGGIYYASFVQQSTLWWHFCYYFVSALGITAGAHRLWSHRSYKANLPLRVLLVCLGSMAYENSIFEWVRDHRVHHKYTDTNADPHNSTRGFFFSHIGWLLVRKHPEVIAKGRALPLDDVRRDPVVMFQHRHKYAFMTVFTFLLPTVVPCALWGEGFMASYMLCVLRYCLVLHATWAVNSFAHMFGDRPYDKNINPSENPLVAIFAAGEGFHNFHHVFPCDYSTSEYGLRLNLTTLFIQAMSRLGWAWDLRKMSPGTVEARKKRTG